jgi:hypothetical protein
VTREHTRLTAFAGLEGIACFKLFAKRFDDENLLEHWVMNIRDYFKLTPDSTLILVERLLNCRQALR